MNTTTTTTEILARFATELTTFANHNEAYGLTAAQQVGNVELGAELEALIAEARATVAVIDTLDWDQDGQTLMFAVIAAARTHSGAGQFLEQLSDELQAHAGI